MQSAFRIITYNIRKGKGSGRRGAVMMEELGDALAPHAPDIVLCQEVFHCARTGGSQTGELADALSLHGYYGGNKHRQIGHHGNSTFTRRQAEHHRNHDLSTNRVERRGVLHVKLPVGDRTLHVFNAHLGLNSGQRRAQVRQIDSLVRDACVPGDPLLLAGDFNDWRGELDRHIVSDLGFENVFAEHAGHEIRTFPAGRPLVNLDRIYTRNLEVGDAGRLHGAPWSTLSDHLPLWADLRL